MRDAKIATVIFQIETSQDRHKVRVRPGVDWVKVWACMGVLPYILSNSVTVFTSAIMNIDPFSSLHQFRLINYFNYQETKRAWSQKICKEICNKIKNNERASKFF
jgi:hypothetical protein